MSLTNKLFNINWQEIPSPTLPLTHGANVTVKPISYEEFRSFVIKVSVPPQTQNALEAIESDWKHRQKFYEDCVDKFGFFYSDSTGNRADSICGVFVGNPLDWETYYLRYIHLEKKLRNQGIGNWFYMWILAVLQQAGVAKVHGDLSPNNHLNIHLLSQLDFIATGNYLSDQWGTLIRYTKFHIPQQKEKFTERFCSTT